MVYVREYGYSLMLALKALYPLNHFRSYKATFLGQNEKEAIVRMSVKYLVTTGPRMDRQLWVDVPA